MKPRLHRDVPALPTTGEYIAQLRAEMAVLVKWGADAQARAAQHVIDELTSRDDASRAEELTLRDAAAESGYSEDHLGRMVRSGTLRNYGRPGSPRVRRGELPRRPDSRLRSVEESPTVGTSKAAIARRITGAR